MATSTCSLLRGVAAAAALATTAVAAPSHAATAAKPSHADELYLQTAIEGDRFEVAGGKIAQQRGATAGVKQYGARLVKDHTKSLGESVTLAKKLGIKVPTAPSPSMQWELQTLTSFTGKDFDQHYADLEAMDHQQDISEAADEVHNGTSADVRQAASKEIPTLKAHLSIARKLGGHRAKDPGA
jgi:putative membrane protein